MVNYYFDTYAIVEMLKNNPSYKKYFEFPFFTSVFNKVEIYWWALINHEQELSELIVSSFPPTLDVPNAVIRDAMLFRKKYSRRNISYADAVGYMLAIKHGLLFLTGDQAFEGLPGVEFVR